MVAAVGAYLLWGERLAPAAYGFAGVVLAGVLLMVGGARTVQEPPHP